MKNQPIRRICALILTLIVTIASFDANAFAQQERETVRIGYFLSEGFQDKAEDGTRSGYSYDYYIEVQNFAKWDYEFIEASYAECLEMLQNGEIDIVNSVVPNAARRATMLFTENSVSSSQSELYAAADNSVLFYGDYAGFDGCTVGILRGSSSAQLLDCCEQNGFSMTIVEYEDGETMEQALGDHRVDMLFCTRVSDDVQAKIVERFPKIEFHYAVNPNRPDIRDTLDDALQKITNDNPEFATNMAEKYMISGVNATSGYTKEEMEYLGTSPIVQVILNADWAPISWQDTDTGAFKGICVDVLAQITALTGITFQLTTEKDFNEQLEGHPESVYNVVAVLADDSAWVVKNGVYYTNRITSNSVVMVTTRGTAASTDMDALTIAMPLDYYTTWRLEKEIAPERIIYCDTIHDGLKAVNEGRADAIFLNELVANYELSQLEYANLVALSDSGYDENLVFVVNKEADAPLLEILNKAMLAIGTRNVEQIIRENSIVNESISLRSLFYSDPAGFLTILFGIMALLMAGAGWLVYTIIHKRRIAEKLAREQETTRARTEFFMMISHELRTPLNAVVGYLTIAEQLPEYENARPYITQSKRAAQQLEAIADDMLDYTKISAAEMELRDDCFDLKDVVRTVQQIISIEAERKNQKFIFTADSIDHEYVIGDKMRLTQIMLNILSNALKFTKPGGRIQAKVSQAALDDERVRLTFTVSDTGIGMSEEFLQRICSPFGQGDSAYSRKHGGMGLGLYLTRYFVSAMDGTFSASSTLGVGSVFTVSVPLRHASCERAVEQGVNFSHIRALICGDEKLDCEQLKSVLKRLEVKCDIVDQEDKILRRIRSRSEGPYDYQLCIIDENMLVQNEELLQQIQDLPAPRPMVFLSVQTESSVNEKIESRVARILPKPIFQSCLFNAMVDVFGDYSQKKETSVVVPNLPGKHAMIVEDNAVNADILSRILKKANMTVTICENGKIAVDRFSAEPADTYQIVFMDIQMPVMNGYAAAEEIRKRKDKKGDMIPILAVSANAFPEDIEKSKSAGMNEHLSKPINVRQLFETINQYLE